MASLGAGIDAAAEEAYPRLVLDNGELCLTLFLPDAQRGYYRGTRFDWSGIIERVDYRGHRFFAPLHPEHDPLRHDAVSGPADEFAMFQPMGYAEAAIGEDFVKIGVGLLGKTRDEEYRFHDDYPLLRAGQWQIENGTDWVSFEQELYGERGWAYAYRKTINLVAGRPELVIEYRLENRGEKRIDINHYNHNFTLIDDTPYGPDYSVELAIGTAQPQSINDLAWHRQNRIEVDQPLGERSLWVQLYQGEARSDYNAAVVRNERSGAALSFEGTAPVDRFVFWAVERAACPEPFSRIRLRPDEVTTWSSRYRFSAGE